MTPQGDNTSMPGDPRNPCPEVSPGSTNDLFTSSPRAARSPEEGPMRPMETHRAEKTRRRIDEAPSTRLWTSRPSNQNQHSRQKLKAEPIRGATTHLFAPNQWSNTRSTPRSSRFGPTPPTHRRGRPRCHRWPWHEQGQLQRTGQRSEVPRGERRGEPWPVAGVPPGGKGSGWEE